MKIAHLSSVHYPFDTRIFIKECGGLAKLGFDVVLVSAYGKDATFVNGVRILGRGITKPRNRLSRLFVTGPKVFLRGLRERADIYHFHDPELVWAGLILRAFGKHVVYDVHEHVPAAILTKHYIPRFFRTSVAWVFDHVERSVARFFSGIAATSKEISDRFPAKKTILVENYAMSTEFSEARAKIPFSERENWIVYIGVLSSARGITKVLDALEFVPDRYGVRLQLGGNFSPASYERELKNHPKWNQVDFHGFMDRSQMLEVFSQSKIGLVLYQPTPNNMVTSANKVFESMGAGLPVLASNFKTRIEVIERLDCGQTVDPTSATAIAETLIEMLDDVQSLERQGMNGARAVDREFNWENELQTLVGLYAKIAPSSFKAFTKKVGQSA